MHFLAVFRRFLPFIKAIVAEHVGDADAVVFKNVFTARCLCTEVGLELALALAEVFLATVD
jgi:hypothetical protein